jgi:hypothetical protein
MAYVIYKPQKGITSSDRLNCTEADKLLIKRCTAGCRRGRLHAPRPGVPFLAGTTTPPTARLSRAMAYALERIDPSKAKHVRLRKQFCFKTLHFIAL